MRQIFIQTENTKIFDELADELKSNSSLIGPSLSMVVGPAGRGKTEAARHYAIHKGAIYIAPMITRTPAMMLREISFELSGMRPPRTDACLSVIGDEMAKNRRLIIIDESDLLEVRVLEMLRNVNELFACPIILLGEDALKRKIASRRRLLSRMRNRLEFGPISQHDISFYLRMIFNTKINADVVSAIHRHTQGDWRPVLTLSIRIDRAMKASGISEITEKMVKDMISSISIV